MRFGRIALVVVVVLAVAAAAYYFILGSGADLFAPTSTITESRGDLAKRPSASSSLPYKDDYGMTRVAGYIDNQLGKELKAVQVEVRLLDDKNNKRELLRYEVTDVAPRSRKSFDVNAGAITGTRKAEIKVVKIEAAGR